MSKEGLKEDLINDINRLLNKENKDNTEEYFNQNILDSPQEQQHVRDIPPHVLAQLQNEHMQQQMHQEMPRQMQQEMHDIPPQVLAQFQHQQMQKQLQMQAQQQADPMGYPMNHQMGGQMNHKMNLPSRPVIQSKRGMLEHLEGGSLENVKNAVYTFRDPLVLFLLFSVILTPQVNSILNKVPYASGSSGFNEYPSYVGIMLRGVLLVGVYLILKNMNVI
jgi:hypothetical protein